MNQSKMQRLLAGQSATARKVFEAVPIQEPWSAQKIRAELERTGASGCTISVVRACVCQLYEAGLIRQPIPGLYLREAIELKPQASDVKEPVMNASLQPKETQPTGTRCPLDLLGELSAEAVSISEDFSKRMRGLAQKIDSTALAIAQDQERNTESLAKLQQLQQLLKSL